jgi:hypothetical protein
MNLEIVIPAGPKSWNKMSDQVLASILRVPACDSDRSCSFEPGNAKLWEEVRAIGRKTPPPNCIRFELGLTREKLRLFKQESLSGACAEGTCDNVSQDNWI